MKEKFNVIFLEAAINFIEELDTKSKVKVLYNIERSKYKHDPKLFKKLNENIWEFITNYNGKQIRLFAFWNKTKLKPTLVITTSGVIKKVSKVPKNEIRKAERIRKEFLIKNTI